MVHGDRLDQVVFQEDGQIWRGNASLAPTTSSNVNVLVERYFPSVGVVSGGFFCNRLNDHIFPFRFHARAFGEPFEVTQTFSTSPTRRCAISKA